MRALTLALCFLGAFVSISDAQSTTASSAATATAATTATTPAHHNWHLGPTPGLAQKFDPDAMLEQISEQIVESPGDPQGYIRRARLYNMLGQYDEAIEDSSQAVQLSPNLLPAYFQMARAYKLDGLFDQAIATYNKVLELSPRNSSAYVNRGQTFKLGADHSGNLTGYQHAIADYRTALALNGNNASAYNNLAWLEATCTNATYRNGKDAVVNALRACQLTRYHMPAQLDTLAAAYAETGDYKNAVKFETMVTAMTNRWHFAQNSPLLAQWKDRLAMYEAHKPLHLSGDTAPAVVFGTTTW